MVPKRRSPICRAPWRPSNWLETAAGGGTSREALLGQCIKAGLGGKAEIAGERELEADPKAITAAGGDDRLHRNAPVPRYLGKPRDVLAAPEPVALLAELKHCV